MRRFVLPLPLLVGLLVGLVAVPGSPAVAARVQPLERAHAHNDYEHDRPLADALARGFTSVEVDVYLVGDQLLVGHDPTDLRPGRTIESLYLDPLRARVRAHGGRVLPGYRGVFQLLVDLKTEGATYLRLHDVLRGYAGMLTTYRGLTAEHGAVTAVVSGNRPMDLIARQPVRYAAFDGRLGDLNSGADADFMPLISDNWTRTFTWQGSGPMPATEREALRLIVRQAHLDERRVRFWATPDLPGPQRYAVWRELVAAGVDHINTDDLGALKAFLLRHDPRERAAA